MLSPIEPSNRSEPLLARHARWMHQRDRRAYRQAYLAGMPPVHAVAILESTHDRRSRALGSESSADILTSLAIEDMRRGIHRTYLPRAAIALLAVLAAAVASVYLASGYLSARTEDLTRMYIVARGLPDTAPGAVTRDVAGKAARAGAEGVRGWLQQKLGKRDQASSN